MPRLIWVFAGRTFILLVLSCRGSYVEVNRPQHCSSSFYCHFIATTLAETSVWIASTQYEPPRDKTNKITCAPSEDSDQPGHPPSLIRVFAVRSMGSQGQALFMRTAKTLIKLCRCPGWAESSSGAHATLLVLSRGGSNVFFCESDQYTSFQS